jgi:uncharacterized radical SAM protein YgiQ
MLFLPTTSEELARLGWKKLDVILITGDAYIDSSHVGVSIIGKVLLGAGYKVGIIAQPDFHGFEDITRLGEPALFWGVTSGCTDSMVANYTAVKKPRKRDDLTAGGVNTRRPDRAVIVYSNLIRRHFRNTKPIVLGGIEASLRRISHYDYWSNTIRRSILFDAKADILAYGTGEQTVLELAETLRRHGDATSLRGICYISPHPLRSSVELPSHEKVVQDKRQFIGMFKAFYENTDPFTAKPLCQKQDTRYLVQNPPQLPLDTPTLDRIYELPFARDVHPYYKKHGEVRALATIQFSLTTHRGCYGECRFCAITVHQGRQVVERSEASILREAELLTTHLDFKGYIQYMGGPTANMYGTGCTKMKTRGACKKKRCLFPTPCNKLSVNHRRQINLLTRLRGLSQVKGVFIGSGIRHDLVLHDRLSGLRYLEEIVRHHISGQLKIAPEHCQEKVLCLMGKPGAETVTRFKKVFDALVKKAGRKQFLTYYLMAAHPGCTFQDMVSLKRFVRRHLRLRPEQVQIYTPAPSTYSALMYYTETDPFTGTPLFVEKHNRQKERQKKLIVDSY